MQRSTALREGLPARWYFDPGHHQLELEAIWHRQWLCVGRATDWPGPGQWRAVALGDQRIIVTRNREGVLRAFHDTCRHRGSALCTGDAGRFAAGRITCPYHAWSYSLDGELLSAPLVEEGDGFRRADFPLYRVAACERDGFAFINLDPGAGERLDAPLEAEAGRLAPWPLAALALAHREVHEIACNWKVFWENYSECYHCPGTHPALCALVPLYREGVADPALLPAGHPLAGRPADVRTGARTWSPDGATPLPDLPGLDAAARAAGMTFADFLPSMFVIAHPDYVRSVRLWPLSPERSALTVDWLLPPEVLAAGPDIARLTATGRQVVLEDAVVCAANQAGLRSRAHRHGVLLPIEAGVAAFDDWVRAQLAARTAV